MTGAQAPAGRGTERDGRRLGASALQRLTGGALSVLAVAALAELWRRGLPLWDENGPGPAFFPAVLAAALLVLGGLVAREDADAPAEEAGGFQTTPQRTARYCLLLAGMIVLFPWLGGLLSLSLFVVAEMVWVERARVAAAVLSGIVTFALVWLVFVWLLAVPLPGGNLPAALT